MKETQTTLAHAIHLCSLDNSLEYKFNHKGALWIDNDFWVGRKFDFSELLETATIRTKQTAKEELVEALNFNPTWASCVKKEFTKILENYNIVKRE